MLVSSCLLLSSSIIVLRLHNAFSLFHPVVFMPTFLAWYYLALTLYFVLYSHLKIFIINNTHIKHIYMNNMNNYNLSILLTLANGQILANVSEVWLAYEINIILSLN